jgi:hypothetical protein
MDQISKFGLPHGGGWRNEKPLVIRVIEVFEQEFEAKQAAEMRKCARLMLKT